MRIALVTETFLPAVDGTVTTVRSVADRLIDTGHEVRIIAPGPGLTSYRGARIARVPAMGSPVLAGRRRTGREVRAALDGFAPDLVHATSPGDLGRPALEHARHLGVATLVVEQSPLMDVTSDHWRRKVAARADAVLVTSGWMVERLAEFGVRAGLWLPGVDTDAFSPQLRDPSLRASWSRARSRSGPLVTVGCLGSLRRRLDVRRLAELACVPGIRPVVIGDGPQVERLRSRLPGAKFVGALGPDDLTVALASLDVLVHPGERETCCHALREAGASGVPLVAPRAGGAPGVVRHLESGLLYDPADPHGLTRAVAAVAADGRRSLLGARARDLSLGRGWSVAVDELVTDHYLPMVASAALTGPRRPAAA